MSVIRFNGEGEIDETVGVNMKKVDEVLSHCMRWCFSLLLNFGQFSIFFISCGRAQNSLIPLLRKLVLYLLFPTFGIFGMPLFLVP